MSRRLLIGTVLLGVGIGAIVFGLNAPRPLYARSVSAFLAQPVREQKVRVEGRLVPGSLCQESEPCGYRFRIRDRWSGLSDAGPDEAMPELAVRSPACLLPDTLRDVPGLDVNVIVEGELCANCHRLEASQILGKCPAVYRTEYERYPPVTKMRRCAGS